MIGQTVSHYKILSKLGEGGMGEVYKAVDTRLERVVALKFLTPRLTPQDRAQARFVQEAKAASALDHPNVCTVYEIDQTQDGRLFIAMACYEGDSLKDLIARGRLAADHAVVIAQQIAQGLLQAHDRGIIHRDIKPGNVLIAGAGLVKIVDFGLALLSSAERITQSGGAVGTVAYMAPEQIRGEDVDHRADIWSLGVTLYEMVTGTLPFPGRHQQEVIHAVLHHDPISLERHDPDIAPELQRIIRTCLQKSPAARYRTMADLLADLQALRGILEPPTVRIAGRAPADLTGRLTGRPYPGLAAFTEADAGFFHGREREVAAVWEKLQGRQLLAIIGPSGAGKSSFLRAGLIPAGPAGWGILISSPGSSPFLSLRQALVPELAGDTEAIRGLLGEDQESAVLSAVMRWRRRHTAALLIIDQFEELFTLSAPEAQERFAELLGKICSAADVHVLLSLRDDFLFHCHAFPALAPVFDSLTPLGPLSGDGLRQALTQPAIKCGYRFGDDALVDEMLSTVSGERGALPLLAFALSQLWERRDRTRRLLTRQAYNEIGGVGGALAQHAEAAIEGIGSDRVGIVRELFRNLVTSQGTRAARSRDELLSLFANTRQTEAEEVLSELIQRRLLTSYEMTGEDGTASRRIEIVHESLLANWPRLVRWQTQDADAAQLRDQIRQATGIWQEKGCPEELLWSGTLYHEYRLWRERYPGALTTAETQFTSAMEQRARRKRRRRILAVAGSFLILSAVLLVVLILWQRSERAEGIASREARHASASLLASLGTQILDMDKDPTRAAAHAIASLDLEDNLEARFLAMRALAEGPLRFEIQGGGTRNPLCVDISPDGQWFAVGWTRQGDVVLYPAGGGEPRKLIGHRPSMVRAVAFDETSRLLVSSATDSTVRLWSIPDGALLRTIQLSAEGGGSLSRDGQRILTWEAGPGERTLWRSWSLLGGDGDILGRTGMPVPSTGRPWPAVHPDGLRVADWQGEGVHLHEVNARGLSEPALVGRHASRVLFASFSGDGERLASSDEKGVIKIWDLSASPPTLTDEKQSVVGEVGINLTRFDPVRPRLASFWADGVVRIWDLDQAVPVGPLELREHSHWVHCADFHNDGRWILSVASGRKRVAAWPLSEPRPLRLIGPAFDGSWVAFSPDGEAIATLANDGTVWLTPLTGPSSGKPRAVFSAPELVFSETWYSNVLFRFDPAMKHLMAHAASPGILWVAPVEQGEVRRLDGLVPLAEADMSRDGCQIAAFKQSSSGPDTLVVWDLVTDRKRALGPISGTGYPWLRFMDDNHVLTMEGFGKSIDRWDVASGAREAVGDGFADLWHVLSDGKRALGYSSSSGDLFIQNLQTRERRNLLHVGPKSLWAMSVSPAEDLIALRFFDRTELAVVPLSGGAPYYLFVGQRSYAAFDPQRRWIATIGYDQCVMLWPWPTEEPLMGLSHEQFLTYLKSQTNVRVVPDSSQSSGYRATFSEFEGWEADPGPLRY